MIHTVIQLLEQFVVPLGGMGVFLAEVIEEIIVPIPSAAILLGSGFIFLKGAISLSFVNTLMFTIVLPATAGLTLGSLVIYGFAYKGGKPFLDRYEKWLGVGWSDVEYVTKKFEGGTYDEVSMILARVFPIIPSVLIAVFCGVTRMPYRKYIILTAIGAFFKALFLALIGWQVGELYLKYANIIGHIENTVFVGAIMCITGFIIYRKVKQKMIQ